MAWIVAHWAGLVTAVVGALALAAAIFGLAGNSAAVARIEAIEAAIEKLVPPKV